jgi:hypothetical protein
MRVLDIGVYDAILGYDWLKSHSPMICHWKLKTIEFWTESSFARGETRSDICGCYVSRIVYQVVSRK